MGFNLNHFRYWVVFLRVLVICNLNTSTVLADLNITVDDPETSIINYVPPGAWTPSAPTTLDFGGSHTLTSNPDATASFTFTGTAIYFLSPLWPYIVNTAISLDSGPSTLVDLIDHSRPSTNGGNETVQYQVVWQATGLANAQHNLLISVGAGQVYAIVDGLIYTTVVNSTSISPTSTSSHPSSTANGNTTPTSSTKSKSQSVLVITLGSSFGVVGLLVIFYSLWYLVRRRKKLTLQQIIDESPYTSPKPRDPSSSVSSIQPNAAMDPNDQNWAGYQPGSDRYYIAVTQCEDGQYSPYKNAGIPPLRVLPHPYFHSEYQNSIDSSSTFMHQPTPQITDLVLDGCQPCNGLSESTIAEKSIPPQMGDGRNPFEDPPPEYRPKSTAPLTGPDNVS